MATFLEVVNDVMCRMRKDAAFSIAANNYTKLIGKLVLDAKRFAEDAHHWSHLWQSVELTTSSGVEQYSITGTNGRTTLYQIIDGTNQNTLKPVTNANFTYRQKIGTVTSGAPSNYRLRGVDSNGALQIDLWPIPAGAYTLWVDAIIPQDNFAVDGTADATEISVPWEPIALRAWAYAMKERGEDQSAGFNEALSEAKRSLARAIVLDRNNQPENRAYRVV